MATIRLVAEICVSPQVTDSKIASWMNVNCSWMNIYSISCNNIFTYIVGLTCVWTIFILLCLIMVMAPGMSTNFSFSTCSRIWSMTINVPVRPTPALQEGDSMWWAVTACCSGTPKYCTILYLQCTSMGPLEGWCWAFTLLWKAKMGVA